MGMTGFAVARPSTSRWAASLLAVAVATVTGWAVVGRPVALAIVTVAIASGWAGWIDATSHRIPNRLVLVAAAGLVLGCAGSVLVEHRSLTGVLSSVSTGVLVSGAPLLALLWLVRPSSVGAGDVKLLSVQAATIGLVAPVAAVLPLIGAVVVGLAIVAIRRSRTVPLGPGLALGFAAAAVIGAEIGTLLSGAAP